MITYRTLDEVIAHRGLRMVMLQGLPSPWGQAAKAIFEVKKLDYVVAPFVPGGANEDIVAWAGVNSAPIVAWGSEKPVHTWLDILHLAERLQPAPALIPAKPVERALMIGLSHEICGELGIGWNRRLQMFAPAMESDQPGEGMARMGQKYRYNPADQAAAGARIAQSLNLLSGQLQTQADRGVPFFIGDALSALDLYWASFMNLIVPLPEDQCPIPASWRPSFIATDPAVTSALSPILVEHRDRIFRQYFRSPMEL